MLTKKEILEVLSDWNYWDKNVENLYNRQEYEKNLIQLRDSKEIIALIGVRRSGKSSLMKLEISNLLKEVDKEQILFVNLEDPRFTRFLNTDLLEEIFQTYKIYVNNDKPVYLFLDEIQNIENWEKWVRMMHELNKAIIYITGSSSKLLSKELATVLAGRSLTQKVFPLSFKEFLEFKGINDFSTLSIISKSTEIISFFNEYIKWGGFPKIITEKEPIRLQQLQEYFYNILIKDIVSRYNIKNSNNLEKLASLLVSNNTLLYSANKIRNNLGISLESCLNYIEYIKESMLMYDLHKFDYSLKKQNVALKKIYSIDTGFVNAVSFQFSKNQGRLLENLVFIELKRRNKEVYYHKIRHECDFVVREGLEIIQAIQVTQSLQDEDTKKRELKGLLEACKTYNLKEALILTQDEESEEIINNIKITILPIWKWLLVEN